MQDKDVARPTFSSEARYRMLVEAVTDYAIYMLDQDGFVASWNPGAQRLKGYTEAEILGRHFSQFYTDEDRRGGLPQRALATATREDRFEAEGWRVRKGGGRFWASVVIDPIRAPGGELIGFAKVTRDLTERRASEEALRRSEEQFRLLVQGVTDYAIFMLDAHGIVTNWNAGAQRIKGYTPEEIVGSHFSRFYRAQDMQAGLPEAALATARQNGRFESEGWRVRKDGSEFWAHVVVDPIKDPAGTLIGFAKVTRDVTEKREAAQALEKARQALFQSQKLDAIGQLTGGVAHDFNNLLMVILSSLELMRRRMPDDDRLLKLLDNAVRGAKRGASLTQRMLAFARRQDLKPAPTDVGALILGMGDLLERSLGPAIRIETAVPADLTAVLIDANQLELAILNLAVNARDAMPDGGSLSIWASQETVTGDATLPPGVYVRLVIADSGAGMDKATLDHAMEPFFTTKGAGKGTGLGLPMVYGLAAQSGGRFQLSSTEGVGTCAELWLPAVPATAAAANGPPTPPASAQASADRSLCILVVDDDALVLGGTVSMLEDLGHSVRCAASGQDALQMALAQAEIELVITDHAMPGMTGVQLIDQLRRQRPGLPVVLATGFAELSPAQDAPGTRLAKPFDQAELSRAIAQALAQPDL